MEDLEIIVVIQNKQGKILDAFHGDFTGRTSTYHGDGFMEFSITGTVPPSDKPKPITPKDKKIKSNRNKMARKSRAKNRKKR